jgi:hypothetical protein
MKAESEGSVQRESHTCPVCGTKFFATAGTEFCAVCILHRAFDAESAATGESGSVSSPGDTKGTPQVRRFEHYEVMLDGDGEPIELGRGAMGVTYKALDVDLRCPVTLKVIGERYPGDESARLRFVREPRRSISAPCSRPATGSPCPKSHGVLPELALRGCRTGDPPHVRSLRSTGGRAGAWCAAEIACNWWPCGAANRFAPYRVADDSCQVEEDKTPRPRRSA